MATLWWLRCDGYTSTSRHRQRLVAGVRCNLIGANSSEEKKEEDEEEGGEDDGGGGDGGDDQEGLS